MSVHPFVGRATEVAALREWAREVERSGVGRFVLVAGPAGSGKSRLVAHVSKLAATDGLRPVLARCWGEAGDLPLAPWPDVIDDLARRRGRTRPDQIGGGDRAGRFRQVLVALEALGRAEPAIVMLDDLQLAGPDAVSLTRFVARSIHRLPLLLVATWRTADADGDKVPNAVARDADVLPLRPFDETEVAAYVEQARGVAPSPTDLDALMTATAGHPMFMAELLRDGQSDDAVPTPGLQQVLRRRVLALAPEVGDVHVAAAIAGEGAAVREVAQATGRSVADVSAALQGACAGVTVVDRRVRFSHELVRQAFVDAVSSAERRRRHLAAAEAVSGHAPTADGRRARHLVEASWLGDGRDPAAVTACSTASRSLRAEGAFEEAAELAAIGVALAVGASDARREAALLIDQAEAVLATGRLADARDLFDRAIAPAKRAADWPAAGRAALGLGGIWVEEQRDETSRRRMLALCRQAVEQLGPSETSLVARLQVRLAAEQAYDGGPADAVGRAVDTVRELGDPATIAEALSLYHHTLLMAEHGHARLEVADELLDAAAAGDVPIYSLLGLCWRTVDLYLLGDDRAERSFGELREQATALGSLSIGYIAAVLDVMRTFRRGDLARAELLADQALALGEAAGDADALAYYGGHLLGIRWVQGRIDEMAATVTAVVGSSTLRRRDRIYTAVKAYLDARAGDLAGARRMIDLTLVDGAADLLGFSNGLATLAIVIEAACEIGDGELAASLAEHFAPYADRPVMPSLAVMCLGPGHRVLARVHDVGGRADEAIDAYRAALAAAHQHGSRPFEAIVRGELAGVLQRRGGEGDAAEATSLLDEAVEAATQLGLTGWIAGWQAACAIDVTSAPTAVTTGAAIAPAVTGSFERCRDAWKVTLADRRVTVDDVVGMRHLAELVARPDVDVPATELSAAIDGARPEDAARSVGRGEPTLDGTARRNIQRRLTELETELDVADAAGDVARSAAAAAERQFIVAQLRRDLALGGRPRRMSDDAERCRTRVSKAIRRALEQIAVADPALGRTLRTCIRTGHTCRYESDPNRPIRWRVSLGR